MRFISLRDCPAGPVPARGAPSAVATRRMATLSRIVHPAIVCGCYISIVAALRQFLQLHYTTISQKSQAPIFRQVGLFHCSSDSSERVLGEKGRQQTVTFRVAEVVI